MSDNIFEQLLTCFFFKPLLPIHSDSKQLFREIRHDLNKPPLSLHVFFCHNFFSQTIFAASVKPFKYLVLFLSKFILNIVLELKFKLY